LKSLYFDYWNSFYAATDVVGVIGRLSFGVRFLFLDFVLKIILQQGQRISSVSSHTSHQLQRFSPY
tara:strand:+ start:57 stop:254 length:198 start_codon:yes stop_codon:yes gene_type:complete